MSASVDLGTSRLRHISHLVCGWSAALLVFAAPISRSLFIASGLTFCLSWFCVGQLRGWLTLVRRLPITPPLLTLASIISIWSAFSPAPPADIINTLKVYSKLLLFLMLVATFSEARWRSLGFKALTASMLVVLASTYANVFVYLPWSHTDNDGIGSDHSVFVDYISQGVMTSIFVAVALHRTISGMDFVTRAVWGALAAAAIGSIVLLLQGRSGLVSLAVVLLTYAILHAPRHKRWTVLLGLLLAGALLVASSTLMQQRLHAAYEDIATYQPFSSTSLGLRIDMWKLALDQTLQHPFTGTGAGTYHTIAAEHFGHCNFTCTHPHNQYLFFSMEYGIFGLLALIWLFWCLARMAYQSTTPERALLIVLTVVIAVDSLYNVPLWYRAASYFFYVVLGLFVASNLPCRFHRRHDEE